MSAQTEKLNKNPKQEESEKHKRTSEKMVSIIFSWNNAIWCFFIIYAYVWFLCNSIAIAYIGIGVALKSYHCQINDLSNKHNCASECIQNMD